MAPKCQDERPAFLLRGKAQSAILVQSPESGVGVYVLKFGNVRHERRRVSADRRRGFSLLEEEMAAPLSSDGRVSRTAAVVRSGVAFLALPLSNDSHAHLV